VTSHTVTFTALDRSVEVPDGTSLLEAAARADIVINSVCGGDGICGRCKMIVRDGAVRGEATTLLSRDEVRRGVVLACRSIVAGDIEVEIPEETRAADRIEVDEIAQRFRAIRPGITPRTFSRSPLVEKVFVQLDRPTLDDNLADCQRLQRAVAKATGVESMQVGLKVLRRLPDGLRDHDYGVTALVGKRSGIGEVMDVEGGDTSQHNIVAVVDVGTSTVVAHLVNVNSGRTLDAQACFNSQAVYGREVTTRIIAAEKKGIASIQEAIVGDINSLVATLASRNDVALRDITAVVCSGNTTMIHLLLGLPVRNIRRDPFIAATAEPPPFRAAEVGLRINPRGLLFTLPAISSWVGGDLTAGILATGMHERDETCMLIDIGTNGEIIIGNKDWLMACSASTGPALEGAGVSCGMMAEGGAIEKAYVEDGDIRYRVIGNKAPEGICGSGIVDLVAVLVEEGIIDRSGAFVENGDPRVEFEQGQGRFVMVPGEGKGVCLTQDDIQNVVTAKAAVFAAIRIMMNVLSLEAGDIKKVFLAGGFGSYINRRNAIRIGLLPDMPVSGIQYVGNTSIWGATLAALSTEAYEQARSIRRRTTYHDLMATPDYVDQFKQAMFLPHTNIELFPSVGEETERY